MRQAFDLLGHPLGRERLEGLDQARVQHPPPLQQEAAVGHLVRQGMLEGVFRLGEQAGLIQELRRLEVRQAAVQRRLGQLRNGLEQGQGHLGANHGRRLQEPLLLRRQPVDACCQHRLHRGRHLNGRQRLRQAVRPRFAHQHPGLHQGAHALLQKEGIALGARNQELLEGRQAGIVPQQGLQELVSAGRGQRVEPQLRVVGLAAPAVLVLGPVVDQQQQAGGGQALHQAIEQGLGLGIDPVQVLKHQQQRLHLAFAQQHALEGLEGALAALRRIEGAKRTVLRQHLQERQQRREGVLQGLVERQHLAGHLGPHRAGVILLVEVAVALEQVKDGEVGCRLAVGHRGALQHQPALGGVGMDKLIGQARLAHARLAHQRHHLAVPGRRLRQRLVQGRELGLPPDKARQPPGGGGLQAPPQRGDPDQLKRLHRRCQALDRHGPQGIDAHQALHQPPGGGGEQDGPRGGELFHARRQVRVLAHRRVVHVQIVANGPHHHLAGVQPDAQLQHHALRPAHLVGVGPDGALQGQRRIAGAQGVVLVGNGGAKQGHNAIAEHLIDGALKAVHGLHHQADGGVQELLGRFRIQALDEPGRVLDVGKEDGDLFAFAFQGGAGGEDLVGEMGRRVGQRRGVWLTHPARCRCGGWRGRGRGTAGPDQHGVVLIHRYPVHLDEFELDILDIRLVQVELAFERPIRQPTLALEQGHRLVENLLEGHGHPSTWVDGAC